MQGQQAQTINLDQIVSAIHTNIGQFYKTSTRIQFEHQLQSQAIDYKNQIFNMKLQNISLHDDIKKLSQQKQCYEKLVELLQLQKKQYENNQINFNNEINELNLSIQSLKKQKNQFIQFYEATVVQLKKDINQQEKTRIDQKSKLSVKIQNKETDFKKYKQKAQNQKDQLIKSLQNQKKEHELNRKQLSKVRQDLNDLQTNIRQTLSQFNSQNQEQKNQYQLLGIASFQLKNLLTERQSIVAYIRKQEEQKAYENQSLIKRIEEIIETNKKKTEKYVKRYDNFQIFINQLIAMVTNSNKKYQKKYGSQLKDSLQNKFIDMQAQIVALNEKMNAALKDKSEQSNKDFIQLKKQHQIKIKEMEDSKKLSLKQLEQKINGRYTTQIKKIQKQNKQIINTLTNQLKICKQNTINLQMQIKTINQQQSKNKASQVRQIEDQMQALLTEKQKLQIKLKQKQNQVQSLKTRFQTQNTKYSQLNQKINAEKIRNQTSSKQSQQFANKIKEYQNIQYDLTQQLNKLKQETYSKTKQILQLNKKLTQSVQFHKSLSKQINNLSGKCTVSRNKIQQITNQICYIVNTKCLVGRQQGEVNTYNQAIKFLNQYFNNASNKSNKKQDTIFKLPSLKQNFQNNMEWVKTVISSHNQFGVNFKTKFIKRLINGQNLTGFLQNKHTVLLCLNSKGAVFCKAQIDTDPITIFSGSQKIQTPPAPIKGKGVRTSFIQVNGNLILGRLQITIQKDFTMSAKPLPDGYFPNLQLNKLFRMQPNQKAKITEMQIYQIVPE